MVRVDFKGGSVAKWLGYTLDFESLGPPLESHYKHFTDLFNDSLEFSNPSAVLVNSQLVGFPPVRVGILDQVVSFAINTADPQ